MFNKSYMKKGFIRDFVIILMLIGVLYVINGGEIFG